MTVENLLRQMQDRRPKIDEKRDHDWRMLDRFFVTSFRSLASRLDHTLELTSWSTGQLQLLQRGELAGGVTGAYYRLYASRFTGDRAWKGRHVRPTVHPCGPRAITVEESQSLFGLFEPSSEGNTGLAQHIPRVQSELMPPLRSLFPKLYASGQLLQAGETHPTINFAAIRQHINALRQELASITECRVPIESLSKQVEASAAAPVRNSPLIGAVETYLGSLALWVCTYSQLGETEPTHAGLTLIDECIGYHVILRGIAENHQLQLGTYTVT